MWWKIRRTWNNVLSLMQLHIPTLTKKGTLAYITKTIAFCLKQGCFIRRLKIHDFGWQRGAKDFLECQNIHFNHMLEGNKGCAILRKQEKNRKYFAAITHHVRHNLHCYSGTKFRIIAVMAKQQLVQANDKNKSYFLCERNPPMISGFLSQRVSNAESVSISWRHHDARVFMQKYTHYAVITFEWHHTPNKFFPISSSFP